MSDQSKGVLRHLLTFAGGILITMGYLDESTMNQLTGALMTIIGVAWSVMNKAKSR